MKVCKCPKCGNTTNFGYPPCAVGTVDIHVTCYKCGKVFIFKEKIV